MRSEYNILWLDDDFLKGTTTLDAIVSSVSKYLTKEGFIPNINKVSSVEEVKKFLSKNKKIDLFLSDYNIDDSFSGLDFLVMTRKKYKQEMLLYSNQSEEQIRKYLIDFLKGKNTSLELFGKFTFESAIRKDLLVKEISRLIDLTLIRWNELNALRGLYLSETSQLDSDCKEHIISKLDDANFINNIINNFKHNYHGKRDVRANVISSLNTKNIDNIFRFDFFILQCLLSEKNNNELFTKWEMVREIRNGCAHVKKERDNKGDYILLKTGVKIYEKQISLYRVQIQDFLTAIYDTLNGTEQSDPNNISENLVKNS